MSIKLISPSIEPWMTRETESNCALRWTNLDDAHTQRAEGKKEGDRGEKGEKNWGVGWGFKTKKKTSRRGVRKDRCTRKDVGGKNGSR